LFGLGGGVWGFCGGVGFGWFFVGVLCGFGGGCVGGWGFLVVRNFGSIQKCCPGLGERPKKKWVNQPPRIKTRGLGKKGLEGKRNGGPELHRKRRKRKHGHQVQYGCKNTQRKRLTQGGGRVASQKERGGELNGPQQHGMNSLQVRNIQANLTRKRKTRGEIASTRPQDQRLAFVKPPPSHTKIDVRGARKKKKRNERSNER